MPYVHRKEKKSEREEVGIQTTWVYASGMRDATGDRAKIRATPKNDLGFPSFLPYTRMCTSKSATNEPATSTRSSYCSRDIHVSVASKNNEARLFIYLFSFLLKRILSTIWTNAHAC